LLREFGNDLKQLREHKGISIAEISAETRINPKFLNLIESGVFDFQPETYIRSFLKGYARAIEEDEKRILNDYDKAKAGFYSRRKFAIDESKDTPVKLTVKATPAETAPKPEKSLEPVYVQSLKTEKPDYFKPMKQDPEPEFSNRSITQKILLIVLIIAIGVGIYFLIDYLNSNGDKKSNVKPKSFKEMSSEYENKISGKKDSTAILDSLKKLSADSLHLVIKAIKDIKVIVIVDDDAKKIEEDMDAKDSLVVTAGKQFRFSSSNGPNTDIYLNGRYLRKSVSSKGTSIKNMIINKDGIQP
jgi:cytoskeletal protein RodZ